MTKWQYITEERLSAARIAIENALADRDILTALSVAGYGESELWEGQALYLEARAQSHRMPEVEEETAVSEAKKALMRAWVDAEQAYVHTRRAARAVFRGDPETYIALKLNMVRKTSLDGWLGQASDFYNGLLDDQGCVDVMANVGYDRARLMEELGQVQAVSQAREVYESEAQKAATMTSTVLVDIVPVQLDAWMAGFEAAARTVLKDHPQWLKKLGLDAGS
jgi:hypothetical protein